MHVYIRCMSVYLCAFVSMCLCLSVFECVCVTLCMCLTLCVCMFVYVCLCVFLCVSLCVYVSLCVCSVCLPISLIFLFCSAIFLLIIELKFLQLNVNLHYLFIFEKILHWVGLQLLRILHLYLCPMRAGLKGMPLTPDLHSRSPALWHCVCDQSGPVTQPPDHLHILGLI